MLQGEKKRDTKWTKSGHSWSA